MTPAPVRVLVVDDHVIVRRGIRALLAESEDIEVVGEAGDGLEAIRQAKCTKPAHTFRTAGISSMRPKTVSKISGGSTKETTTHDYGGSSGRSNT